MAEDLAKVVDALFLIRKEKERLEKDERTLQARILAEVVDEFVTETVKAKVIRVEEKQVLDQRKVEAFVARHRGDLSRLTKPKAPYAMVRLTRRSDA